MDMMMEALLMVDIQNDFLPGGALAVPCGDEIIPLVNALQHHAQLVVATQDWHPPDHASFASQHAGKKPLEAIELDGLEQILWPDHCVQDSVGADFGDAVQLTRAEAIIRKGTDRGIDTYSGFFDNGHRKATGLGAYLKGRGIERVFVAGLAAEYCVAYTLLDARRLGFEAVLIEDATRAIDGDDFAAMRGKLKDAGVVFTTSPDIL
jgi:nicotinamidase/pyrazinamidase